MKSSTKYPVLIATLILFAYVIAIMLWNADLTLGALLTVFASSLLGAFGAVVTIMELVQTKKKVYIFINVICLIIMTIAALTPLISFFYVDFYGF